MQSEHFDRLSIFCQNPECCLANPAENARRHLAAVEGCEKSGGGIVVFPELSLTGSTCGDLFRCEFLLDETESAVEFLLEKTAKFKSVVVFGAPLREGDDVIDAVLALQRGKIIGKWAKSSLSPSERHFFSTSKCRGEIVEIAGFSRKFNFAASVGNDFDTADFSNCIVANPRSDRETPLGARSRHVFVAAKSCKNGIALAMANAGRGESTTDFVFAGDAVICDCGQIVAENAAFSNAAGIFAEIDLSRARKKNEMPAESSECRHFATASWLADAFGNDALDEIFEMQVAGLRQRFLASAAKCLVLGLSGGLDSALAFLVCAEMLRRQRKNPADLHAFSMPCFGTSGRTKSNAETLAKAFSCAFEEIPIGDAVLQHFAAIGHDPAKHDSVFENSQARERTQILMDEANKLGGIVVGTGDMSEIALGWCTFAGDQIAMYNVNAGLPKTVVRRLVERLAKKSADSKIAKILLDIVETPISPELLPSDDGEIVQKTENIIGTYELHDFFLWHFCKNRSYDEKIIAEAEKFFAGRFETTEIMRCWRIFKRRFLSQQFKRSCAPDGPAIFDVSLSPRCGWTMPSDISL